MPELPEVETARRLIAEKGLHRRIADSAFTWVSALDSAIARGGVHTGEVIAARHPGGTCPRCGAEMRPGTVGGRSTWWCSREQEGGPRQQEDGERA